jgi:hypothetical protein
MLHLFHPGHITATCKVVCRQLPAPRLPLPNCFETISTVDARQEFTIYLSTLFLRFFLVAPAKTLEEYICTASFQLEIAATLRYVFLCLFVAIAAGEMAFLRKQFNAMPSIEVSRCFSKKVYGNGNR